jgi:4-oxalocrotonate tautomerase
MPFIHVTLGRAIAPQERDALAADLTQAIASLLGKRREVTAVLIDVAAPTAWYVDGAPTPADETPAHVDMFITAGSNEAGEKAQMIAATQAALMARLGTMPLASYVVIHEIDAGDWGYGGQTQAARRLSGNRL